MMSIKERRKKQKREVGNTRGKGTASLERGVATHPAKVEQKIHWQDVKPLNSHTLADGSITGPHRGELSAIASKAEPLPTLGHNFTFSLLLLLLFSCQVMSDPFETPWTVSRQAPLSVGLPRQECWSVLPFPSPGDLPDRGIEPMSSVLTSGIFTTEPPGKPLLLATCLQKAWTRYNRTFISTLCIIAGNNPNIYQKQNSRPVNGSIFILCKVVQHWE